MHGAFMEYIQCSFQRRWSARGSLLWEEVSLSLHQGQSTQNLPVGCSGALSRYSVISSTSLSIFQKIPEEDSHIPYARLAFVQDFPLRIFVMPPNATAIYGSVPEAFIKVPMQPRNDIRVYIMPGWMPTSMALAHSTGWDTPFITYVFQYLLECCTPFRPINCLSELSEPLWANAQGTLNTHCSACDLSAIPPGLFDSIALLLFSPLIMFLMWTYNCNNSFCVLNAELKLKNVLLPRGWKKLDQRGLKLILGPIWD